MKNHIKTTMAGILFGALAAGQAAEVLIPNGDFEDAAGPDTGWVSDSADGFYSFEFYMDSSVPGNSFVFIDSIDLLGFGLLIANDNTPIPLTTLGLTAGETYSFRQDMKFTDNAVVEDVFGVGEIAGTSQIGGLKIDYFIGNTFCGTTGDIFPGLIGDGSTWETYDFQVYIPPGVDGIKVTLLRGAESTVSFDNVVVETIALPPLTEVPNGDFDLLGDSWGVNSGFGTFDIGYRATGGSGDDGEYGYIDNSTNDGGFGILIANNGGVIPLSGLGLLPDNGYVFSQDMNILSGTHPGGLKVEYYNCGNLIGDSADLYPVASLGTGWNTYDFEVSIPAAADGIKIVPIWGPGSEVGYDNFTFSTTPIFIPGITVIPNGDFEQGGVQWTDFGAPNTTFTYPSTGGSGDNGGYAQMANNGGGFGVIVSNSNGAIPIDDLNLEDDNAYTFSQDMRIETGINLGGVKVEFYAGPTFIGSTGDLFPELIGTGATWETYDFVVHLPLHTDGIKVVPLWGSGSTVCFDNVVVNSTVVLTPAIPDAGFDEGLAFWVSDGPQTTFTGVATGGNPGGFAEMDNFGSYGVLVANRNNWISLASLGLVAGETYTFTQDMISLDGPGDVGGLKIDFYSNAVASGSSNDIFVDPVGDGSIWETYEFEVEIPVGTDAVKIVPLWGASFRVGFDNIAVSPVPVGSSSITVSGCGFDANGNFYLDVAEGVSGLKVTTSVDPSTPFTDAGGVTNDGVNRFTISAASLDLNSGGKGFFRVEEM